MSEPHDNPAILPSSSGGEVEESLTLWKGGSTSWHVFDKLPADVLTALPGIPPIAEFVPGYEANIWHGIAAPKNTPPDIVATLNKAINAAITDPALKAKFANLGAEPMPMTPVECQKFIAEQIDKWGKVVKFAGMKPE